MSSYKKEIGGYLELECSRNELYHENGVYVNSARNALRYIIRSNGIKTIYLPDFTCPVVWDAVKQENCEIRNYPVSRELTTDLSSIPKDAYIVVSNYFGIQTNLIQELSKEYPYLIIDNAQAFFAPNLSFASFYSPRKFFGLSDGGIAVGILNKKLDLLQDQKSYSRCGHLLKRHDLTAQEGYLDFIENDGSLNDQPILEMSKLTQSLMGNINYESIKKRRRQNFKFLHQYLSSINLLKIELNSDDIPMAYPLITNQPSLRKALINEKIYVPTYWPKVEILDLSNSALPFLKTALHALPIDQRYDIKDMLFMINVIKKFIEAI